MTEIKDCGLTKGRRCCVRDHVPGSGVAEIRARCDEAGLALPSYVTIARRIPGLFSPEEIARKRSANPKHLLRLKPRPGYIHAPHPLDVCQIDHTPTDLSENKVARPG